MVGWRDLGLAPDADQFSIRQSHTTSNGRHFALYWRSVLYTYRQEYELANNDAQQALDMAESRDDKRSAAMALTAIGHTWLGLNETEKSKQSYEAAKDFHLEMEQINRSMEPHAGLAHIAWASEERDNALVIVDAICTYLQSHTLDHTEEAFQVYLICYRILNAVGDPRRIEILQFADNHLNKRASSLHDKSNSLFWAIPNHREIQDAMQKITYQDIDTVA